MKITSSLPGAPGRGAAVQSATILRSASRIRLRAVASTDRARHSASTMPATPSGPAATSVSARTTLARPLPPCNRRSARRRTFGSNCASTDLISPSSASAPVELQALYQTVCTPSVSWSLASTSRIRLLLPIPQPPSSARVKGVERREASSSADSCSATHRAPSSSSSAPVTGSSLSSTSPLRAPSPIRTVPGAAGPGRPPCGGWIAIPRVFQPWTPQGRARRNPSGVHVVENTARLP